MSARGHGKNYPTLLTSFSYHIVEFYPSIKPSDFNNTNQSAKTFNLTKKNQPIIFNFPKENDSPMEINTDD